MTSGANAVAATGGAGSVLGSVGPGVSALDPDAFLRLMVTQLSHQDPFNAADSSQMIEQFTLLGNFQSMQRMADEFGRLSAQSSVLSAAGLVGRTAEYRDEAGAWQSGLITSARVENGVVLATLGGIERRADELGAFTAGSDAGPQPLP